MLHWRLLRRLLHRQLLGARLLDGKLLDDRLLELGMLERRLLLGRRADRQWCGGHLLWLYVGWQTASHGHGDRARHQARGQADRHAGTPTASCVS